MLYCSYGSNISKKQMAYRCPNSTIVGDGTIDGWELVFKYHADIVRNECSYGLPVLLWDIADEDWDALDRYEGYPTYYVKKKINVNFKGNKREAIVYVMTEERQYIEPPYEVYFNIIKEGYEENGLCTDNLYYALNYAIENVGERI